MLLCVCVTECGRLCGEREREGERTEPGSVRVEREGDRERERGTEPEVCVWGCVTA